MKPFFSLIIFLIFSNYCNAHTPKFKVEKFGNVKTFSGQDLILEIKQESPKK